MYRNFIKLLPLSVFLSVYGNTYATNPTGNKKPNILFCIADDASLLGAYGVKWVHTPAFDRVAEDGILFNNMFTCNAKSAPSRATIITGRNSWQLDEACNHWAEFPLKYKSFMEVLEDNGYYVGHTSKGWAPGIALDANGNQRYLTGKPWNDRVLTPEAKGICKRDYAANFKDFLKSWDGKEPFCFWYGSEEPHRGFEYESSVRFGRRLEEIDKVPGYLPDNDIVRRDLLDYAIETEHFDKHIGMMLQTLEEIGELDNTVVIITSDHGMSFPRVKGQAYFDSNHIPLAIMWKNGIKEPGRVEDDYYSTIDIAPTILELAGISGEDKGMATITGHSMVDVMNNNKSPEIDRGFVMIGKERHDVGRPNDWGYPIRGIIRDGYLYLRNFEPERWPAGNPETGYSNVDCGPSKTETLLARKNSNTEYLWELSFGKRPSEELYNIIDDSDCIHNLADNSNYKSVKERLRKELFSKLVEQGDPRVFGFGYIFDEYPNMSNLRGYYNRRKNGERLRPVGATSIKDFEPYATGLSVPDTLLLYEDLDKFK